MSRRSRTRSTVAGRALAALLALGAGAVAMAPPGLAAEPVVVATGAEWAAAWADPAVEAITLAADVELACGEGPARDPGAAPLVVDGDGHAVTNACLGGGASSFVTNAPITFRDVGLVGGADGNGWVLLGDPVVLDGALVIVRNMGGGVRVGPGSTITGTTIDLEGTGGEAGLVGPASITVDGLRVRGQGNGIRVADEGVTGLAPATIEGAWVDVTGIGLVVEAPTVVDRSSLDGSVAAYVLSDGAVALRDSTLVAPEGGRALATAAGARGVALDHLTVVVPTGTVALDLAPSSRVSLHATVLADGECTGAGELASDGDNVASDDSCATSGPGDRVLAEAGLEPYDPDTGRAEPDEGGPLVDAVASCGGTGTDQRGVARPQGAACDIGAVELEQQPAPPTPTTDPPPAPAPGTAPPATPIVDSARFTG